MRLDRFDNSDFDRGRRAWVETLWVAVQAILFSSWIPGSAHRVLLLRWFGASIGGGVIIKPRVRVKFPWRLSVGDHVWLGEGVWIDNLAPVEIGSHVCVSQEAYLCTGNHDWSSEAFDLVTDGITIRDHAWIGARCILAPGVDIGEGAVVAMASTAVGDLRPWHIYQGVPADVVKPRKTTEPGSSNVGFERGPG